MGIERMPNEQGVRLGVAGPKYLPGESSLTLASEASIPRRPTDDTHIIIIINNNNTSSKQIQIQTHHEDYWIDCIYHDASCYYCGSRILCELFPKSACPYRPKMLLRLHFRMRGM